MASITMYGAPWCSDCRRSKALLDSLGTDYEYIDVDETVDGAARALAISGRTQIPVIQYADGSFQVEPSDDDVRAKLTTL